MLAYSMVYCDNTVSQSSHTVFHKEDTRRTQGEHTPQYFHTDCTECYIQIKYTLHNTYPQLYTNYSTIYIYIYIQLL